MLTRVTPPPQLSGVVRLPGDKSVTHRAFLFNAIAQGEAVVTAPSRGADCLSTIACLKALGVSFTDEQGKVIVRGVGLTGLREPSDILDCGNSGTTLRLLMGVLAAQPFLTILNGDSSLRSRPVDRVAAPLKRMGARIRARGGDKYAPVAVDGGPLQGIEYPMPVASAQVKSALLLAGLYANGQTVVVEPAPTRDHTERLLHAMGARIQSQGNRITVAPGPLQALSIHVPGDISAAAFWLVAGVLHPNAKLSIVGVGVNPTRAGVIDVLRRMGAHIAVEHERLQGGEPVADLTMESSSLTAIDISGPIVPNVIDELPVLALAAACAKGVTTIRDAAELRVKESDRIKTTTAELRRLGAHVQELPDGMRVTGGAKLRGARCQSYGDHRLAMMLAVAGLVAHGETDIEGAEAASVSYPGFWQDLERLGSTAAPKAGGR